MIIGDMMMYGGLAVGALRSFREAPIPLVRNDMEAVQLASEAGRAGSETLAFIYAPEPQYERLSVPQPALKVENPANSEKSTAGVHVVDLDSPTRFGVAAALHGVEPSAQVTVDGATGNVIRTDGVTDSAFIEVPGLAFHTTTINGVMTGMAPRGQQIARFDGITSQRCSTIITGWDAQIPTPSSRRQACIYTRRDAQPGDSGAALVTDDDWLVGFAFERSKPQEVPAQCSWIWAESVLERLRLKLR